MLTEKENYLRCINGGVPEWIPFHGMSCGPEFDGQRPHNYRVEPRITTPHRYNGGGLDMWGVEHVTSDASLGALNPDTRHFILDDITKWRDVIKAPSLEGIDWEQMVKDDFAFHDLSHDDMAIQFSTDMSYFMMLVEFMGYEDAIVAMVEEPEEVAALFDYMCDFYCEVARRYCEFCKPDIYHLADDVCAQDFPMVSPETFRELLLPYYDRQAELARELEIPISFHMCGKCEGLLDDLVGIGVSIWEPAQTTNDLGAIKAKYGNGLVIIGGWDGRDNLWRDDVTRDDIYEYTRQQFDMLAPGGGYCFVGGFMGLPGSSSMQKNEWLMEIYNEIKYDYYK